MGFRMLPEYPGWGAEGECSGECCRLITLSAEPELIAELAAGSRFQRLFPGAAVRANGDAEFVERHFIPVRKSYYDGVTGKRLTRHSSLPQASQQYRCGAWDGATRRCTRYDDRPDFCLTYGYSKLCQRDDCTLRPYPICVDRWRWEDDGGAVRE